MNNQCTLSKLSINFRDDPDIRPDIRFLNFLNINLICMKLYTRVYNAILMNLRKLKLDPDIRPDIQPDIRINFYVHKYFIMTLCTRV